MLVVAEPLTDEVRVTLDAADAGTAAEVPVEAGAVAVAGCVDTTALPDVVGAFLFAPSISVLI